MPNPSKQLGTSKSKIRPFINALAASLGLTDGKQQYVTNRHNLDRLRRKLVTFERSHHGPKLSTALMEEALISVRREPNLWQAIERQLLDALASWAIMKMGKQGNRYLELAVDNFVVMAAGMVALKQWEVPRALRGVPLIIPITLPKNRPSPFDLMTGNVTLFRISAEYETLLTMLKKLKTQTNSSPTFKMALKENLVGGDQEWIKSVTRSTKPSDIATMYLVTKYRLKVKHEALKKRLIIINHPKRLLEWIDTSVSRVSL